MFTQFVVLKSFSHQMDCYCPCCYNTDEFQFLRGDVIEIQHEKKFLSELGWYFLIEVNQQYRFYMALDDLEQYYIENSICSLLDLELQANFLRHQVDQALNQKEKERFITNAQKLKEVERLKKKVKKRMKVNV